MPLLYDAQYWRDRADEARVIADTMTSVEARGAMLEVADSYDRLVEMAERRSEWEPAACAAGAGDGKSSMQP